MSVNPGFQMFPDISDRMIDANDEEYFDIYTVEHHMGQTKAFKNSFNKVIIVTMVNLYVYIFLLFTFNLFVGFHNWDVFRDNIIHEWDLFYKKYFY